MNVKNILVPVDFSSCSKNALQVAIGLAKGFGAKIHMVNAVHVHTPHADMVGGSLMDAILMDYEAQVKKSFEELETELIELQEVPHEADRFIAYLTDAIYTEAQTKQIDLIVMGTRSHHDGLEHLIGSRTTDVIDTATVPVIIIPEHCTSFHPKKIGFAFDLTEVKNFKKLAFVKDLAAYFQAELLVFSVHPDPSKLTLQEQKLMEQMMKKFEGVNASARTAQADSTLEGIRKFTQAHGLELISMVPRERGFFEKLFKKSVTKNLALDLEIPMLTFRE